MLEKLKKRRWICLGVFIVIGIIFYLVIRVNVDIPNFDTVVGLADEAGIWLGIAGFFVSLVTFVNTKTLLDKRKQNIERPLIEDGDVVLAIAIGESMRQKIRTDVTGYLWNNKETFKSVLSGKVFKDTEKLEQVWNKNINGFDIEYGIEKGIGTADTNYTKKGRMVSICTGDLKNTSEELQKTRTDLYEALEEFYRELTGENWVNKVHLFYSGPVVYGAVIGDFFSNQDRIELYHYASGSYLYAGSLSKFKSEKQE